MAKYREQCQAHGLRFMAHGGDEQKRLVVVGPALEKWLLLRAKASGVSPAAYGLPDSARLMHKNPRLDRKPGFHQFLADLAGQDEGMKTLKKWLAG